MTKQNTVHITCLFSLLLLSGCSHSSKLTHSTPDFHFILKYGIEAKNVHNTFEGTFTKDLIVDSPITTSLSLTPDELDSIKNEMDEIKIFEYPDTFRPRQDDGPPSHYISFVQPYETYYFKIQKGKQIKEISWSDSNESRSDKAIKLRALIINIVNMIENKNEYKELPLPHGAYL